MKRDGATYTQIKDYVLEHSGLKGTQDTVKIDFFDIQLEEGNQLVMCSDGLSNMVTDEDYLM